MFSLAIDFFDEFGLERLTEPEKPLNDCRNNSSTKNELSLRTVMTEYVHMEVGDPR